MSNDFFSLDDYNQDRRAAMTQCPDTPAIAQPAAQHLKDIYAFLISTAPPGIADEAFRNVPNSILLKE